MLIVSYIQDVNTTNVTSSIDDACQLLRSIQKDVPVLDQCSIVRVLVVHVIHLDYAIDCINSTGQRVRCNKIVKFAVKERLGDTEAFGHHVETDLKYPINFQVPRKDFHSCKESGIGCTP